MDNVTHKKTKSKCEPPVNHEKNKSYREDKQLLLTLTQAAELLSVSKKTIYRLADEGNIRILKIRNACRISVESLYAYLQRLENEVKI